MGFCTTMIVRLTSFTSSRLLITKSANLAIVLASDFHWYQETESILHVLLLNRYDENICRFLSARLMAAPGFWMIICPMMLHVIFSVSNHDDCNCKSKGITGIRMSIENQRKKNFPKTHHLSFFAYSKSYYKHYPTALQRHLIFLKKLTAQVKIPHFYLFFQFFI